ncbi:Rrf2 family transcriptional regulator [Viridibacillus arvi]|uniref:Rrf2 family transcriptional regulator n=1 Tax=Viridibacillus arvi TaxID=263475 RepID=UPI003CFEC73F
MQLLLKSGDLGPKWFHIALRSLVLLADHDKLLKSNEIADILHEDSTFVRKILSELAKADYVQTYSGRYGGYKLQCDLEQVTVKDIYIALGNSAITSTSSTASTGTETFISLIILKAETEFQNTLGQYTLAQIVKHKNV